MGVHTTRTPKNLDEYLTMLIREGHASSYGNAINLIILERMMGDKKKGEITPFKYRLRDLRMSAGPNISEIGTDNIEEPATFPLGEAPPIAGPLPAERDSPGPVQEQKGEYGLPKRNKPKYAGTMEEYEKEPLRDYFEPPEA